MAPLSAIPGRIRLESRELIGKGYCCRALTNKISTVKGVIKADINPRTGRILIIFDNLQIMSDDLITRVNGIINEIKSDQSLKTYMPSEIGEVNKNNRGVSSAFINAVINIAGNVLLPKPLGSLLPIALQAVRAYPKAVTN